MKKNIILVVLLILLAGLLFVVIKNTGSYLPWSSSTQMKIANDLVNKGLYKQAVSEYRRLLEYPGYSTKEKANILYIIGNVYMEKLNDYENAIASYLMVKTLLPKDDLLIEVNPKIVECFEKIGRPFEAQQEMDKATALDKSEKKPGETITAKIGNKKISLDELYTQIRNLPPYLQDTYKSKEKQLEFLKDYIITELLFDSAKRRNYDKDPEIIKKIDQMKKGLIVQKLIEDEIKNKVSVSDDEIKLYYEAHKKEFIDKKDKQEKQKSLDEAREQIKNTLLQEREQHAYRDMVEKLLKAEKVTIYEDIFKSNK
ncbi:MAG: hypothetical protein A2539_05875 [Elusimicrobia bacterium RIFOXYD2_FULL_34_15]|nr:MAG: hypothetical protein A2539_05875 [Elusimicrobia bacterium RIFOXYD2_FULL_34_15]